ncbi:unnamed protein product [Phyllotreta striolata]|uniref:Uncharacterized protein n=1 Tax=Phyllotreta striolata TaxID=444603 RepID=A0A9N9TBT1_PHYSR|nr:unnamed protein product [Phyllotreta striolata]
MKGWWCIFGVIPVLEAITLQINECPNECFCDEHIADCHDRNLDKFPDGIGDADIVNLDVSVNRITKIPDGLSKFASLKYLNVSNNRIAALGHMDLTNLTNLQGVDFTYNSFHDWKDIHSQVFTYLPNLTYLNFSSNPISNVPPRSTHFKIKSLEILKLNNCSMTTIPNGFLSGMTSIKELHFSLNPIQKLNTIFYSKSLKLMDISRTFLTQTSPNAFVGLRKLETLLLNRNRYLRNVTINSETLLYLDISDSFLETPPYGAMKSLVQLNLYGNIIRILTNNIFANMSNLRALNLSLNAITSIEANAFRALDELKILDLSYNKISVIEESTFLSTKSLLTLDISHNYLTSIDSITSMSLNVLNVGYCEIKTIGKFALSTLPKLTKLSLQRNFISYIPDELVGGKLRNLDLSDCRIKLINNMTFKNMCYLQILDLSSNRLTSIQSSNFPPSLAILKLKDNQWRCDCSAIKDTFEWLQNHESDAEDLLCDSPENFDGETWQVACQDYWYPTPGKKDHVWWYSVALIISMIFLLCTVIALRKINEIREKRIRELEETRRQNERDARETLQRMRQMHRDYREETSRNAPDPRDSQGPPSYNDALLLPRLDSSHPSLAGSLHSIVSSVHGSNPDVTKKPKVRRKRRRRRSDSAERLPRRSIVEDSNDSEPDRSQRPLESDF